MSHFSAVKTKIKDLGILQRVCQKRGLNYELDSYARGYDAQMAKADFVIKLGRYDIGFVQKDDKSFEAQADFSMGSCEGKIEDVATIEQLLTVVISDYQTIELQQGIQRLKNTSSTAHVSVKQP